MLAEFPHAAGFVRRVFEWLGPRSQLTEVQQLMLERMLLTVEQFFKYGDMVHFRITDTAILEEVTAVGKDLFEEGGRGPKLDAEIAERAGLPKIGPTWEESQKNRDDISDPEKKALYEVCCDIASGVCTLSDCHHNTFRFIERWIHGIGTGQSDIPTRAAGAERERLARLLFGYVLGLDKWLLGVPMQFLLMDLGHVDLGFDPRNEVLRAYAHLGEEKTPVKLWLAACLWHNLSYARMDPAVPAGLVRHPELLEHATALGVSVREWMDSAVASNS